MGVQGPPGPPGPRGPKGDPASASTSVIRDRIDNATIVSIDPDDPTIIEWSEPETAIVCEADTITITMNGVTYNLELNNYGTAEEVILQKLGETLTLNTLRRIVKRSVNSATQTLEDISSISCEYDHILLTVNGISYPLILDYGEEGSPLMLQNNVIGFGPPRLDHNVFVLDALPAVDDAEENAVYFIYDSTEVIDPQTVNDITNPSGS